MGFFKAFGDNVVDTCDNIGRCFSTGGRMWANGNYLGAFSNFLTGTGATIGNVVTLGGANALGTVFENDITDGNGASNIFSSAVEYAVKNEAESILTQQDLSEGRYRDYEYDPVNAEFVAESTFHVTTPEQAAEFDKLANMMGAMDTAGKILDTAGAVMDVASFGAATGATTVARETVEQGSRILATQAVTAVVRETGEEIAEQAVDAASTIMVREATEEFVEEVVEGAVEQGTETAVRELVEEAAETAAETTVRETAEQAAERKMKESMEDATKDMIEDAVEDVAENAIETGIQNVMSTTMVGKGRREIVENGSHHLVKKEDEATAALDEFLKNRSNALGSVVSTGAAFRQWPSQMANFGTSSFSSPAPKIAGTMADDGPDV